MHVSPYVYFDGNCEEAFNFYVETIGAGIEMMSTYDTSPVQGQVPPEWRKKIVHARLRVGGTHILASDSPPGRYEAGRGYSITLSVESVAEAERIFENLSQGGEVSMPIVRTFFASRFGMLTDRFGISWMILCNAVA